MIAIPYAKCDVRRYRPFPSRRSVFNRALIDHFDFKSLLNKIKIGTIYILKRYYHMELSKL